MKLLLLSLLLGYVIGQVRAAFWFTQGFLKQLSEKGNDHNPGNKTKD